MCRLYTFRSNFPSRVECELIESQNSLLSQSIEDSTGESNLDGWGLGIYNGGVPHVARQVQFAANSARFRREAGHAQSTNVVAHVRRATFGVPRFDNTHPFAFRSYMMAHNGTIGSFPKLRPYLLELMAGHHRQAIRGSTDSEHFFHLFLSRREQFPDHSLADTLRRSISDVVELSGKVAMAAELSLNIILTDGTETIGSRLGRTLYTTERLHVHCCRMCNGARRADSETPKGYRAIVVASEIICDTGNWQEIHDGSIWHIDKEIRMSLSRL